MKQDIERKIGYKGNAGPLLPRFSLLSLLVSEDNMKAAIKRLKRNTGLVKWERYRPVHEAQWSVLRDQILKGIYKPKPVTRKYIRKPEGGTRPLSIPEMHDRLIQQAVLQVISPQIESGFSDTSYGYIQDRNAHQAISKAVEYVKQGYEYVIDLDIEKFFDTINVDRLMSKLAVPDKAVKKLIGRYTRTDIIEHGKRKSKENKNIGIYQGGPLSPFLANVYLDELDKYLEYKGYKFIRYADDLVIWECK